MHCLSGRKLYCRLHLHFVVCWAVITITVVASVGRVSLFQFVASVAKTPFTDRQTEKQTNRKAHKQTSRKADKPHRMSVGFRRGGKNGAGPRDRESHSATIHSVRTESRHTKNTRRETTPATSQPARHNHRDITNQVFKRNSIEYL